MNEPYYLVVPWQRPVAFMGSRATSYIILWVIRSGAPIQCEDVALPWVLSSEYQITFRSRDDVMSCLKQLFMFILIPSKIFDLQMSCSYLLIKIYLSGFKLLYQICLFASLLPWFISTLTWDKTLAVDSKLYFMHDNRSILMYFLYNSYSLLCYYI